MKTFGLIWPDGTQELRSIVLDDEGNPRLDALEPNPKPENWQAPQVVPLVKIPKPEQGAWEPNVVWFEDRVERQWVAGTPAPAPTYTAEQWIDSQGYTAIRLISLLDAEAKLMATNKTSAKMTAVRSWLDSILGQFAINPTPQADWVSAPYGYEETIQEAITALTANPET